MPTIAIKNTRFDWVQEGMPVKIVHNFPQGIEQFKNLTEARQTYPDLDPWRFCKEFTWGMKDQLSDGTTCMRFETREVFKELSK